MYVDFVQNLAKRRIAVNITRRFVKQHPKNNWFLRRSPPIWQRILGVILVVQSAHEMSLLAPQNRTVSKIYDQ